MPRTKQIRISGKDLGSLAMPDFCERCFWIRMACDRKLPFQIFPGIFSSIDSYSKKVTNLHHAHHGRIPPWLEDLVGPATPMPCPGYRTFNVTDQKTNILMTGVPDELLRKEDGSSFIADYKTARFTDNADSLMPIYVTQLNAYAIIADAIGLGPVSGLGLIYYEPATSITVDDVRQFVHERGFDMRFNAHVKPIEQNKDSVPPLLRRVREICDMAEAPAGLEGCKDCGLVDRLLAIAGNRRIQTNMPGCG